MLQRRFHEEEDGAGLGELDPTTELILKYLSRDNDRVATGKEAEDIEEGLYQLEELLEETKNSSFASEQYGSSLSHLYDIENSYVVSEDEKELGYIGFEFDFYPVPQSVLGPNVLGRAWPYMGFYQISEELRGEDRREVMTHEESHCEDHSLGEIENRYKTDRILGHTRYQLPWK